MHFDEAIAGLPAAYAEALRMRGQGMTAAAIAAQLNVPPESIDTHFQLAEAKLAALRSAPPTSETEGPDEAPTT